MSGQMPTLILSSFFGPMVTGYYSLTQRVLAGPSSIISVAVGDVFRQRASEDMVHRGNCREIYISTFKVLAAFSLPTYAIVGLFAPGLFSFVFGERWNTSGRYAQILSPFFMLSFSASILSRTMYIAQKQKQDMLWQLILFALITLSLLWGASRGEAMHSLVMYSFSYCCMYIVYLWMSFKYSGGSVDRSEAREKGGTDASGA
jgi:O-antigen/teichoic acid export membrane protein